MKSILIKHQTKEHTRNFTEDGEVYILTVKLRYDDECGNGHNTFAMTGEVRKRGSRRIETCGCIHDTIIKVFPEFAHLEKWHLCSSDGPMQYMANTLFHVSARDCWGYLAGEQQRDKNGLPLWNVTRKNGYSYIACTDKPDLNDYFTITPVVGDGKEPDLNAARSSAIWPEATTDELYSPNLKVSLENRLPKLLEDFKQTMENLGFTF